MQNSSPLLVINEARQNKPPPSSVQPGTLLMKGGKKNNIGIALNEEEEEEVFHPDAFFCLVRKRWETGSIRQKTPILDFFFCVGSLTLLLSSLVTYSFRVRVQTKETNNGVGVLYFCRQIHESGVRTHLPPHSYRRLGIFFSPPSGPQKLGVPLDILLIIKRATPVPIQFQNDMCSRIWKCT